MTFYSLPGDNRSYYAMDTCIHREGTDMVGLCARCEDALHDQKHPTPIHDCFACKVSTVRLTYTYGREDFHGPTLGERIEQQWKDVKEGGVDAEPVGPRWV